MQRLAWLGAAIEATEMQAHLSKSVPWRYHENRERKNTEVKYSRESYKDRPFTLSSAKIKGLRAFTL